MLVPVRLGAHLAAYCSDTEHLDDDGDGRGEIWIFDLLIYDHRTRGRRRRPEEVAEQQFREDDDAAC